VGALAAAASARAATLVTRSIGERASASDRVALVKVGESRVDLPGGDPAKMMTYTRLDVLEDLKGKGPRRLELVQIGGRSGQWERHVTGDAQMHAGEQALVFLFCRDEKAPGRCVLVGLASGKLDVVAQKAGKPSEVRVRSPKGEERRRFADVVAEVKGAKAAQGRTEQAEGTR